jgi:8-oxo-dGTP pyrophosphatase MutT (NUDIX family)
MAITTRREFSAGGVIYKNNGKAVNVALIARNTGKVWCLPKGKIEHEETSEVAAEREVREETGLSGKLIKFLGEISYRYISPIDKALVFKNVRFYLFKYISGALSNHDSEVDEVKWLTVQEALEIMAYPSEKDIMKRALKEISG